MYDILEGYRRTLDRIPDDIVLAIATRLSDETMIDGDMCICGWAIREAVAREVQKDAVDVSWRDYGAVRRECVERFGGTYGEWNDIFLGVCNDERPLIEAALMDRIMVAATGSEA